MKRLALALLGGFLIPFTYAIIVGPLSLYIANPTVSDLLSYPVRWPILILFRFGTFPLEPNEVVLFIYIVACDVLLYSLLSYFLLWRFSKRRKRDLYLPPEPPSFVKD